MEEDELDSEWGDGSATVINNLLLFVPYCYFQGIDGTNRCEMIVTEHNGIQNGASNKYAISALYIQYYSTISHQLHIIYLQKILFVGSY